ncbi:MAG: polyhydroxyalkanoic acid system family protein [Alphaproteobacteria bacterium]|nr:polyhydroxyalkanoic acid system family protein [Alphaproteobacteria bacterium]
MSSVRVRQPHTLSKSAAKDKLAGFEEMLKKYRVSLAWSGDKAAIKGIGVSGDVAVGDSAVDVEVKLGMLAKAAGIDAGRLQDSIAKRLKAAFEG